MNNTIYFCCSSGERESSLRGRNTPGGSGTTDQEDTDFGESTLGGSAAGHHLGQPTAVFTNPNLLPPDYYPPPSYSSSSGGDIYETRRRGGGGGSIQGGGGRRIPASVSSSDNNSDTTYAESGDINSSLRARMQALDNRK